jgi:hypothetical protein
VKLRIAHWPSRVAGLLGTRAAETILASGHVRPRKKAAHMEASDPIKIFVKTLASRSRPHMGDGPDLHPHGAGLRLSLRGRRLPISELLQHPTPTFIP